MTLQAGTAVRNARANAVETTIGTGAILKIRNGSIPATCGAADAGTALAVLALDSDWMGAASGGTVVKAGTWADASADAAGTATHFRMYAADGTTCHLQGTVNTTAADLTLDNTVIAAGQTVTITAFGWVEPNA
jgi:hypothetical protein